jgi:hypothetical protein
MFRNEQYEHGLRSAKWMERNGGSFASALALSYYKADLGNAKALYEGFPHIFQMKEFELVKKDYKVLVTFEQYVVVTANSAENARDVVNQMYRDGSIDLDPSPQFACEECDVVEAENV